MERDVASVDDALRSFITEHELQVSGDGLCGFVPQTEKVTGCESEMN